MNTNELIEKYIPLALSLAKRYYLLDYDDRKQEALLGLSIAANTYDESKGKFGSYAYTIIANRLKSYNNKEINRGIPIDLFEEDEDGNFKYVKYLLRIDSNYENTIFSIDVRNNLSIEEQNVIDMIMEGYTQRACAKEIGTSQSKVNRVISKIKEEIKRYLYI